jgi:hypothetical protein
MKTRHALLFNLGLVLAATEAHAAATLEECRATVDKFRDLGNVAELLAQSY